MIEYNVVDGVAHIVMSRGGSLNAMNRQMYAEVNDAFHRLNNDGSVAAGIFSSSDPKAFSAGVDIKDIHRALTEEGMSLDELGKQVEIFFEKPGMLKKPVIAAINGHCVGEGMIMALFCDLRIASDDAMFGLPEARIGVPSINGTIRAVQLAGHAAAMELLLTGEQRNAEWALNAGFVNEVVAGEDLIARAKSLAASIVTGDSAAIQIMRTLGEKALEEEFDVLVETGMQLRSTLSSDNMNERQGAFVNRSDKNQ